MNDTNSEFTLERLYTDILALLTNYTLLDGLLILAKLSYDLLNREDASTSDSLPN